MIRARTALCTTLAAMSVTSGIAIAATPAAADPCQRRVSTKTTTDTSHRTKFYAVSFGNTCGYTARAYVHYNDVPFGTHWAYGANVKGLNVRSVASVPYGKGTCSEGYQLSSGGWLTYKLDGGGC